MSGEETEEDYADIRRKGRREGRAEYLHLVGLKFASFGAFGRVTPAQASVPRQQLGQAQCDAHSRILR